jgi:hypothetical protein
LSLLFFYLYLVYVYPISEILKIAKDLFIRADCESFMEVLVRRNCFNCIIEDRS